MIAWHSSRLRAERALMSFQDKSNCFDLNENAFQALLLSKEGKYFKKAFSTLRNKASANLEKLEKLWAKHGFSKTPFRNDIKAAALRHQLTRITSALLESVKDQNTTKALPLDPKGLYKAVFFLKLIRDLDTAFPDDHSPPEPEPRFWIKLAELLESQSSVINFRHFAHLKKVNRDKLLSLLGFKKIEKDS